MGPRKTVVISLGSASEKCGACDMHLVGQRKKIRNVPLPQKVQELADSCTFDVVLAYPVCSYCAYQFRHSADSKEAAKRFTELFEALALDELERAKEKFEKKYTVTPEKLKELARIHKLTA